MPGGAAEAARRRGTGHLRALPALAGVLVVAAALAAAGGCGRRDGDGTRRPVATGAHSDAMAPGNALDPPQLADLPVVSDVAGVPVLCYHYFRGSFAPGYALRVLGSVLFGMPALGPREFWTTPAHEFERHLRHFRDEGIRVVTLDEVADLVAAGAPLPARAVVLTIDDADRSVHRHAFPLLRKYGARAHLFVPTAQVGRAWSGLKVCDAAELAEMAASGLVLLDAHTHDMHYKIPVDGAMTPVFLAPRHMPPARRLVDGGDPVAAVAADLSRSLVETRRLGGGRGPWLAWPYGFATPALDSLAIGLGFRGTVSLAPRRFGPGDRDLHVGRFTLTAHTTLAQVRGLTKP
jgi:hypothetical protein